MNSRMDRYKDREIELDTTSYERTNKNKRLYGSTNYDVFSSNETIIDTSNEIDITKLKQMINSREEYKKASSYRNILEEKNVQDYDYIKEYNTQDYEEKNYDINSLLDKVKLEKQEQESTKTRKLINTQYDILSKLDVKSKYPNDEHDDKLQQLINNISDSNEEDYQANLLDDLKGEDTIVTEGFKDENDNILSAYKDDFKETEKDKFDDFLDDSIVFDDDDFEDFKSIEEKSGGSKLVKAIIFVLLIVLCTALIFVLDSMYHFIPF